MGLFSLMRRRGGGFSLPYEIDFTALGDGALPSPWSGSSTMAISSSQLVNTPTLGSELLSNGSMEAGDPPTSWTNFGDAALASEADERTGGAGSASLKVARAGTSFAGGRQAGTLAANNFFRLNGWFKKVDASAGHIYAAQAMMNIKSHTETDWTNIIRDSITIAANPQARVSINTAVDGTYVLGDDMSEKAYTDKSQLFSGVEAGASLLTTKATLTHNLLAGTLGLIANADSLSNPQNCILAWYAASENFVGAAKCVAGTWSSILIETAVTYAAGGVLEIRHTATNTYKIYYNTAQVGGDLTVNDAGIVSNTLHGVYAGETGGAGGIDTFSLS